MHEVMRRRTGGRTPRNARMAAFGAAIVVCAGISACNRTPAGPSVPEVLNTYRQIAELAYAEALETAVALQASVDALIREPSPATLDTARSAWRAARVPYAQTEALRFGNWFVDEWETRINAWPVDEGFLDYVAPATVAGLTNPHAELNLVSREQAQIGARTVVTTRITPLLLRSLQALGDIEANVATGYHAIEFLLWGQDLNGHGPGAGQRPWTDFATRAEQCTDGERPAPLAHCQRRGEILQAQLEHLIRELAEMRARWADHPGSYGDRLVKGDPDEGLRRVLFGLASMSGGELAGERMEVALLAQSPEEEQDCFSDDTHHSHYYNALGVQNFYTGRYKGAQIGPSLQALAQARFPALASQLDQAFAKTQQALAAIRERGEQGERFDQLIAPDNRSGHALIRNAITALQQQTRQLEALGQALQLGSLNPQAPK